MSNEQTLPVYVVPGTDGNPDVYYLRSFTSDPDTQISKEQYDGLTRAISDAAADLQTLHAQADPASPDFVAPAVNADVAGSAAAPVSQPVQTPAVAEDVSASEAPAGQTDQPAQPESEGSDTPSGPGLVVLPPAEPDPNKPDPETNESEGTDNSGTVLPGGDVQSPGTDQGGSPDSGSTAGQDQAQPDTTGAQITDQSGSEQSSPDPNEGTSPDQNQSSGSLVEPDPNENSQAAEPSSSTSEVSDPTDPAVVAGEPLPSSVTDNPATVDPSTGDVPDLTNHPVDSTTLTDPTVVQAPPADLPVEDHGSWFAKEKQRILDILKSESDRVSSEQEPE